MEAHILGHAADVQQSPPTPEKSEDHPTVGLTLESTRTLLHAWECIDHSHAPRVATAKADFFLPFLPEIPGKHSPYVALWKKGGIPDGILIGRLSLSRPVMKIGNWRLPVPRLRMLNITEGGLEALTEDTARLQKNHLQELLAGGSLDCISVFRLSPDGEAGRILERGLNKPGDGNPVKVARWFTEMLDRDGQPVVTNSAKTRSGFRRKDRKLVEAFNGSVEIREIRDPADVTEFLKVAVKIVASSYQQSIGVGVKDDRAWESVSRIQADNGSFRGYLLEAAGEPIAYIVGPVVDGTFTLLATSFLPKYGDLAPGTYLLRRVIERLQAEGVRWIDYGIGDYSYKELFGTYRREDASMHFYASSPKAIIARLLNLLANAVSGFLKSSGLLARLKLVRRRIIDRMR